MNYLSTRGSNEKTDFKKAVLDGLARDGGLFMPETLPDVSGCFSEWSRLDWDELAVQVVAPFSGMSLFREDWRELFHKTVSAFRDPLVTPLVKVGNRHVLELFHGPTFSFKDVALQTLGGLFEHWANDGPFTFLGATSGDTGSAAIHGMKGRKGARIFILYPEGRVSPIQELQMASVPEGNVHCIAIEGDFDDCQSIVKELFSDVEFAKANKLSAVNSINWARLLVQVVYYFLAYFQWCKNEGKTCGAPLSFCVPTGNFGDIFAGYIAKQIGLPIDRLIIASNANDILTRFAETGRYEIKGVTPTTSPSMDIQVSSNFERLLWELHGKNGEKVKSLMSDLKDNLSFEVSPDVHKMFLDTFLAARVSEDECQQTIRRVYQDCGYILDPHSAVGYLASQKALGEGADCVCLSTAHPGKFASAVEKAISQKLELPEELASLEGRPLKKSVLPADANAVRAEIEKTPANG